MLNYYQLLGVKPNASPDEIKRAYHKLMRKYHPDTSDLPREEATQKSSEINQAYRTLSDSKKRQDYDNLLKLRGDKFETFKTDPQPGEPKIGKDPGGPQSPAPWASEEGVRKRTSDTSFGDEEFMSKLKDRGEFKRLIDKYYAVHNTRIRLNWANAPVKNHLGRKAQGADSKVGVDIDTLELYEVELSGSDWSGVVAERIALRQCNLKGANFQDAFITECEFTQCDFTGANFSGAFFQNSRKIQNCNFMSAHFDRVTFRGQIVMIRGCNFKGATAKGVSFTDLSGRPKPDLKAQVLSCLKEPHWKNQNIEEIVAQIEEAKGGKKGFWPFGKR